MGEDCPADNGIDEVWGNNRGKRRRTDPGDNATWLIALVVFSVRSVFLEFRCFAVSLVSLVRAG